MTTTAALVFTLQSSLVRKMFKRISCLRLDGVKPLLFLDPSLPAVVAAVALAVVVTGVVESTSQSLPVMKTLPMLVI